MRIGAHVSASGSIDLAIDRAAQIDAEAVQIFVSPPQAWSFRPMDEKASTDFKIKALEQNIGPNVLHGVYLVSLGSPDTQLVRRGIQSLVNYMNAAHDLDMLGVIFHLGSHKGLGFDAVSHQIIESLKRVLDNSPTDVKLILENSAGMGNHVGSKFAEIGTILHGLNDSRTGVCLDTQHSFAAGYDLTNADGVDTTMKNFDEHIGMENLVAVHCNDSKREFMAGVDRHENIGEGYMGRAAFDAILAHPAFRSVPFYLEVPGYEGGGPDQKNVETMKDIRAKLGIEP